MNISIFGAGYVGLVSGICLAEKLNKVYICDNDLLKIKNLKINKVDFYEKFLSSKLKQLNNKKLIFTSDSNQALLNSNVVIICVNTPTINNKIDLKSFIQVVNSIGLFIKKNNKYLSIIVKSTVPPGTTINIKKILKKYKLKHKIDYGLGMNPEFLREGSAIYDFINSDRIIIGYEDLKTKLILTSIYKKWKTKLIYCNTTTAELIKYANNSLYATLISFINQYARLSNKLGNIELSKLVEGLISDKRITIKNDDNIKVAGIASYLKPGLGYGGSCFPKDLVAINNFSKLKGAKISILDEVINTNNTQINLLYKIFKDNNINLINQNIMIMGIAFKENTDDMRNSISLKLIKKLIKNDNKLTVHDSLAFQKLKEKFKKFSNKIKVVKDWTKEISKNRIIIIMNSDFKYKKINNLSVKNKIIFDNRLIINNNKLKQSNKYLTL